MRQVLAIPLRLYNSYLFVVREALANTRLINFLIEEEENVILWVADTIEVSILARTNII